MESKMAARGLLLTALLAAAHAFQVTEQQYQAMPVLFTLDDHEACLSAGGAYCLGSFVLRPSTPHQHQLFDVMLKYSEDPRHFNHTVLHRGYCVTSRCGHVAAPSLPRRFQRCVADHTGQQHGLDAKLFKLDYCETASTHDKPFDTLDWMFTAVAGLIALMNLIGTTYDLLRNQESKRVVVCVVACRSSLVLSPAHQYLVSWSLRSNWARLVASYDDGDPRLTALNPVQGIRVVLLSLVILGHAIMVHTMAYVQNARYMELNNHTFLSMIVKNGTQMIYLFFVLSSFLSAYNLLLLADKLKKPLSIRVLPLCLLHRLIRLLPAYLFVLGVTVSWWPRLGAGALWTPLVRQHADNCRRSWWAHALFLNNVLYGFDDQCLFPTWFIAADTQLYVVAAALTLLLARRRDAVKLLALVFVAAVLANFAIAFHFGLKPFMVETTLETGRTQFKGLTSLRWLYSSPWGNMPATVMGVLLAFRQRRLDVTGFKPRSKVFLMVYYLWVPALVAWVLGGHLLQAAPALLVTAYGAVGIAGYVLISAVGLTGSFNGVDSVWRRVFSWAGWRPLGRVSLGVLLLHWGHHCSHIALRTQPSVVSVYEMSGHCLLVEVLSFVSAGLLYLFVEHPAQRFLSTMLSNSY